MGKWWTHRTKSQWTTYIKKNINGICSIDFNTPRISYSRLCRNAYFNSSNTIDIGAIMTSLHVAYAYRCGIIFFVIWNTFKHCSRDTFRWKYLRAWCFMVNGEVFSCYPKGRKKRLFKIFNVHRVKSANMHIIVINHFAMPNPNIVCWMLNVKNRFWFSSSFKLNILRASNPLNIRIFSEYIDPKLEIRLLNFIWILQKYFLEMQRMKCLLFSFKFSV